MNRGPLTLEALALRRVIKERGLQDVHSDLVPKMRQELEQLSRLPGDYEIVAEEITVTRRDDGLEVINDNWRRRTKNGERISVACEDCGLRWKVVMKGMAIYENIFLESKTWQGVQKLSYFDHGFVEDGVLKREQWMERQPWMERPEEATEAAAKPASLMSAKSIKLDSRGDLVWTSTSMRDWKGEMLEVFQVVKAKRIWG